MPDPDDDQVQANAVVARYTLGQATPLGNGGSLYFRVT
jgi:hypothetical protein